MPQVKRPCVCVYACTHNNTVRHPHFNPDHVVELCEQTRSTKALPDAKVALTMSKPPMNVQQPCGKASIQLSAKADKVTIPDGPEARWRENTPGAEFRTPHAHLNSLPD